MAPDRVDLRVRLGLFSQLALVLPLVWLVPLLLAADPRGSLIALVCFSGYCWGAVPFLVARTCATPLYRRVRRSIVIQPHRKHPIAGGLEIDGRHVPLEELLRVVVGPESQDEDSGKRHAWVHLVTRRCAYRLGRLESREAGQLASLFRKALPLKGRKPPVADAPWQGGFVGYYVGAVHALGSLIGGQYLAANVPHWSPLWIRLAGPAWVVVEVANLWLGARMMGWLMRDATAEFAIELGVQPESAPASPEVAVEACAPVGGAATERGSEVRDPAAPSIAAGRAWERTPADRSR